MGIQNKKIFASILFVLISFVCMAQTPSNGMPPPPSAPNDGGTPPPGLPIDGALPVLMLVALIYGVKNKLK
jgi:hypothetical protein